MKKPTDEEVRKHIQNSKKHSKAFMIREIKRIAPKAAKGLYKYKTDHVRELWAFADLCYISRAMECLFSKEDTT